MAEYTFFVRGEFRSIKMQSAKGKIEDVFAEFKRKHPKVQIYCIEWGISDRVWVSRDNRNFE